jgi:2-polyprenyl-3-methyl-5-hydroxy-6-metoxy-1,4-benzoquinol methylase
VTKNEHSLPERTASLLCEGAFAKREKILKTEHIVTYYKKANLADVNADFVDIPEIGMYRCEMSGLIHFYPFVVGKSSLYEQLQSNVWYYLKDKNEYHKAAEYVHQGNIVLEIGCGVGKFASHLHSCGYVGLEFNRQAVMACRSKGLKVSSQPLEAFAQKYREVFDVVCAFQVLEHIPAPRAFIACCLYCLKPGGHLIFSVPAEDSFAGKVPNYCLNLPPHHITRWPDKALLAR